MYNCSMLSLPSRMTCNFLIVFNFCWMSMVEDVMTLVRMMYRLILNQDCDKMVSKNNHLEGNMYNFSMLSLPSHLTCNFLIVFKLFLMSMVEDVMTLVRMMYRLIRNQDCDQMELNSHFLLLRHVIIP